MESPLYIGTSDLSHKLACDCSQELKLIDQEVRHAVNGELLKLKSTPKLWTRISFQGYVPGSIQSLELGAIIKIGSMQRLWKKVTPGGKIVRLRHLACDNSIQGHDLQGQILCHLMGDQEISIPENVEFISYRPWLDMLIIGLGEGYLEAEEI